MLSFNVEMVQEDPLITEEEIINRCSMAAMLAANELILNLRDFLWNWDHPVELHFEGPSRGGYSIECQVLTTDLIYIWVSRGVPAYSFINDGVMRFPYEGGRYQSYDPKTGTGTSGDSRGLRHGEDTFTRSISNRDIRPRHIADKALEGHMDRINEAFMEGLNG